jgi:hypothetical protein
MLDALLSFTKAVCKSCLRIRDRYTPASGRVLSPNLGNPFKAMNCRETLDFKEICKYYTIIVVLQHLLSKGKRYEIVPSLAAIVTSCHSSVRLTSPGNMFFLSSNNSTTSTLHFLQIIAIVHMSPKKYFKKTTMLAADFDSSLKQKAFLVFNSLFNQLLTLTFAS